MKRILPLIAILLLASSAKSQALFFETFAQGIPSEWALVNDNNTAYHAEHQDAWFFTPSSGHPAPGIASTSWFTAPAEADRWIVCAPVVVPDSTYAFIFEATAPDSLYPDGFEVRIATRNSLNPSHFSDPLMSMARCGSEWCDYIIPLSDYVGDSVWIALIQNSFDKNLILADNFRVARPDDAELELTAILVPDSVSGPFPLQIVVTNKSQQPLPADSLTYTLTLNGATSTGRLALPALQRAESQTLTLTDTITLPNELNPLSLTLSTLSTTDHPANNTLAITLSSSGQTVGIAASPAARTALRVYPNPSRGAFTVEGAQGPVRLYDLRGRLAQQPLRPGTYILTDGHATQKLIITQ